MAVFKANAETIQKINELYYELHNKAEVARRLGCSPGTVTRYIDPNYKPFNKENEHKFTFEMLPDLRVGLDRFRGIDNFGALCIMSTEELKEIKDELWKEIH